MRTMKKPAPPKAAPKRKPRAHQEQSAPGPWADIHRDGKPAVGNPKHMAGRDLRMYAARLGLNLHDCRNLAEEPLRQSCIQFQMNRINALSAE